MAPVAVTACAACAALGLALLHVLPTALARGIEPHTLFAAVLAGIVAAFAAWRVWLLARRRGALAAGAVVALVSAACACGAAVAGLPAAHAMPWDAIGCGGVIYVALSVVAPRLRDFSFRA